MIVRRGLQTGPLGERQLGLFTVTCLDSHQVCTPKSKEALYNTLRCMPSDSKRGKAKVQAAERRSEIIDLKKEISHIFQEKSLPKNVLSSTEK